MFGVFISSTKTGSGNRAPTVIHIPPSHLDSALPTENSGHWTGKFRICLSRAIDNGAVEESDAENLWQNGRNIKQ
ncbi:hypothetical protein GCM10010052_32350 [Paenarthrobacter histidinolovorans]|nr:hypothetical protein GCM10010052_32350 [Paenarthrobacter histidinolovorans]